MQPLEDDLAGVVEQLRQRVFTLEARVAALEGGAVAAREAYDAARTNTPGPADAVHGVDLAGVAAVAGQGLLGLAGAYLLRALTEQGTLPPPVGYSAGAAYALAWLALVYRAGHHGTAVRAALFGAVSCSVAYPLIWEAASPLRVLGPTGAAIALTLMTAAALLVAASIRLQALAWIAAAFAATTTVALLPQATRLLPATVFIIGLGIATLWLGYVRDWFALRWPTAVVVNLLVCWVVFAVPPGRGLETPTAAVGLGLVLTAAYLGSILIRTLWRARDVLPFEVVQGFSTLAVGLGGVLALGREGGALTVGAITLLFGGACYVAAVFVARQRGFSANFHFYTTMGLALVLTGLMLVFPPAGAALALSLCVAGSGVVAGRRALPLLMLHTAAYAIVAAMVSGLTTAALMRGVAAPALPGSWPVLSQATALLAALCAGVILMPSPAPSEWPVSARLARAVVLAIAASGAAAWGIELALPLVRGADAINAGALATLRSVIVAVSAVLLAFLAGRRGVGEAAWLAYGALALGAVKLLLEDLLQSSPSTLFIALAAYGAALMAAPRLVRRQM